MIIIQKRVYMFFPFIVNNDYISHACTLYVYNLMFWNKWEKNNNSDV